MPRMRVSVLFVMVACCPGWLFWSPLRGAGQDTGHGAPWAFSPPRKPRLPEVRRKDWVANPIDAFVLARLEAAGLAASRRADQLTLLRRVSFDLTGLPPTLEEQDAFL